MHFDEDLMQNLPIFTLPLSEQIKDEHKMKINGERFVVGSGIHTLLQH